MDRATTRCDLPRILDPTDDQIAAVRAWVQFNDGRGQYQEHINWHPINEAIYWRLFRGMEDAFPVMLGWYPIEVDGVCLLWGWSKRSPCGLEFFSKPDRCDLSEELQTLRGKYGYAVR